MMETDKSQKLPWHPVLIVAFVLAVFFVSQILAGTIVSIYPAIQHWTAGQTDNWLNDSIIGQFFYVLLAEGLALGAIYGLLRQRGLNLKAIGLIKPRWSDPLYGLIALPAYYVFYLFSVMVITWLAPALDINAKQQLGFSGAHGFGALALTFVSLVILPPLVEEIMMRGLLYGSLRRAMPKIYAALITSAIFASAHLLEGGKNVPLLWIAFIDTFVLSLVLVYLREKTGSLWPCITLHALKNGVAFISLFLISAH